RDPCRADRRFRDAARHAADHLSAVVLSTGRRRGGQRTHLGRPQDPRRREHVGPGRPAVTLSLPFRSRRRSRAAARRLVAFGRRLRAESGGELSDRPGKSRLRCLLPAAVRDGRGEPTTTKEDGKMARYDSTIRATAVKPAFLAIPLLILGLGMPAPSAVFATSLDLAGSSSGDFKIFKGDGAGGFTILGTPTGVPSTPTGLDVGDLDGDGDNDLGSFHCTQIDGLLRETSDVAVADIDNDGHLDFFLAGGSTNSAAFVRPNRFCLNDGNNPPAFACTDFEGLNTVGAAAADLDRDGDADAVFGNINAAARLCLNDGSRPPSFTCSNLNSTNARGVTVGDVNDDGEIDVIIANSGAAGRVCLNDGLNPPSFSCQSVGAGSGPAVGDFNDDTFVDVAFTGSSNQVCFNDGHPIPAFTCTTFNTNTDAARRVRVADLDGVNGP